MAWRKVAPEAPKITFMFRRTQRIQHRVIFIADLLQQKRYKGISAKGTGTWDNAWRKPDSDFQESFPSGITRDV